jgi:NTP pyrophosphatase (non-canonical NTP hydrolase)
MIDTNLLVQTHIKSKLANKSHDYLINHWHEEVGELMQAINKMRRGNQNLNNLQEEIGDVLILTLCLREIFGKKEIDGILNEKIMKKLQPKL